MPDGLQPARETLPATPGPDPRFQNARSPAQTRRRKSLLLNACARPPPRGGDKTRGAKTQT
eukprot:2153042-Lingulodinium_polyedra.AAC.1